MVGVAGLALAPIMAIVAKIKQALGIKPKPPKTNPRSLVRTVGFKSQTTGKDLTT